jgi:ubiquinone/menaquinone biosynthesis C-methylase UbiE
LNLEIDLRTLCLLLALVCIASPGLAQTPQESRNDGYVDPELDMDRMVNRLEREGREVFDLSEQILDAAQIQPGDFVADVGAGTGAFLEPLVAAVGTGGHVYAVEISIRFVERLRQVSDEAGYDNVTAVFSSYTSATLAPESVDKIILIDTYHHFDDYQAMLASMMAALRPQGEMVVVDFDRQEGVSREWILSHVRDSKDTFRTEIEEAGFEFVEEVEIEGMVENFFFRFRRP